MRFCDERSGFHSGIRMSRSIWSVWCPLVLALICLCAAAYGADSGVPAAMPGRSDETNMPESLRGYLQIQEQLHATQLAIERNRQEANAAAAESAKAFALRLQGIEVALASQRSQELQAMQSSNKVVLAVAGLFVALGFLAMLLMAFFQWRTISRLAEIAAALPAAHALGAGPAFAALGAGETHMLTVGPAEQSNQQLLGTLERLEQRLHQLEHIPHPPLPEAGSPDQPAPTAGKTETPAAGMEAAEPPAGTTRLDVLLAKGQSLLNLDQAEEALACFDQVLALDANHSEALVKKGAALERLRKLDEAIACYDKAIAADNSLTVAYLYKGGLFNRMERFGEALECYEQALRTQEGRKQDGRSNGGEGVVE
jgi:tetratricopeptide (TPR) repeat protein